MDGKTQAETTSAEVAPTVEDGTRATAAMRTLSLFQHATEDTFRAAAEEATGRKVIAFMSGTDIDQDVSCEVFTLMPMRRREQVLAKAKPSGASAS